jgi:hypothetical protein
MRDNSVVVISECIQMSTASQAAEKKEKDPPLSSLTLRSKVRTSAVVAFPDHG